MDMSLIIVNVFACVFVDLLLDYLIYLCGAR